MGHLGQRVGDPHLGQCTHLCALAHDLQAVDIAAGIGGVALGDAQHVGEGLAVGGDPGTDQAAHAPLSRTTSRMRMRSLPWP
jgi:hypothetical protein